MIILKSTENKREMVNESTAQSTSIMKSTNESNPTNLIKSNFIIIESNS